MMVGSSPEEATLAYEEVGDALGARATGGGPALAGVYLKVVNALQRNRVPLYNLVRWDAQTFSRAIAAAQQVVPATSVFTILNSIMARFRVLRQFKPGGPWLMMDPPRFGRKLRWRPYTPRRPW